MSKKTFSRKEIYDLVWSKPISKILLDFTLTNSAFKKVCIDHDIPLPKMGHWQKIKHNKSVTQTPLPNPSLNSEIIIPFSNSSEPVLSKLSELQLLIYEIKKDKTLPLTAPDKLLKPDPLIKIARKDIRANKNISHWNYKGFKSTSEGVFNIMVSKELINRALLFADSLIKLLKKRGHKVEVRTNMEYTNDNGTKFIINDEVYGIYLTETRKRIKVKTDYSWDDTEYIPTGNLSLRIDDLYKHQWNDAKTIKLEDKLPAILAYFEIRAKKDRKEREEREIWHKEFKRKQKVEEELKQQRDKELETFKSVINNSSRWQKSMDLRNYIKAVEQNAIENNKITNELKIWLKWVKDKADWYDPLIEKEDELFQKINRDTLEELNKSYW